MFVLLLQFMTANEAIATDCEQLPQTYCHLGRP